MTGEEYVSLSHRVMRWPHTCGDVLLEFKLTRNRFSFKKLCNFESTSTTLSWLEVSILNVLMYTC